MIKRAPVLWMAIAACALMVACARSHRPAPQRWPSAAPHAGFPPPMQAPPRVGPARVRVRVFAALWQGAFPADEAGSWQPADASVIVDNLNNVGREIGIAFELQDVGTLAVAEAHLAAIASSSDAAARAFDHYVSLGRLSNESLSVIVVGLNTTTWVQGWGNIDQPLRMAGSTPIMMVSTRVAKSREAHWIGHELGHVLGFFDTTHYDAGTVHNPPYTRCGLNVAMTGYPLASAPAGARQNLMSFNVEERRGFYSPGYEAFRSIVDCWIRSSGL